MRVGKGLRGRTQSNGLQVMEVCRAEYEKTPVEVRNVGEVGKRGEQERRLR